LESLISGWEREFEAARADGGTAEDNTTALGIPNSARGIAGGATEDNTSALGLPNLARGAAGGAAEDNTSALGLSGFPNSARGAAGGIPQHWAYWAFLI
jgi:hypothetical protein